MIIIASGLDFESSIGAVISCMGGIGPGIGSVGPAANYNHIPEVAKMTLSVLMIVGRLEIYTVLAIFTISFWKK
jgi:trk system potassium uptake protein TrkH